MPVNGWTVSWALPNGQTTTQAWNGTYTQNGANVTVTNMYYNGAIAPGASTNFGFLVNWNGTNNRPPASPAPPP